MEWYWSDTENVRQWLRDRWNYPRDWREIIPVSMMLYIEGGETVDALDKRVALTPELIQRAKSKYGQVEVEVSSAGGSVRVSIQEWIPSYYDSVLQEYEKLKEILKESVSNPVTWSFAGVMALIVILAGSNVAVAVAISRMQRTPKTGNYRFFRRLY